MAPHPIASHPMTRKASPELLRRLDRLEGCRGIWYLDRRDSDQRGYDINHLPSFGCRTPAEALAACVEVGWHEMRLLFSPDNLNGDSGYGYTASAVYRSNERVFRDQYSTELELADGDGDGIALDLRFVTDDMIETIESLEDYCVLDDSDHSELEYEEQQEAWDSWAASDWRSAVEKALSQYEPEGAGLWWAEEVLDAVPELESKLQELFHACADSANEYWYEESGDQCISVDRVAKAIDIEDLKDLTGLPLLPPDQEWRREPYPWAGAEPAPLLPPVEAMEVCQ
jgi:hypothetical protein